MLGDKFGMRIKLLFILTFTLFSFCARAVKAKPGLVDFVQPDGSVIQIMLHGDESFHYATDSGGKLLKISPNGKYEYAEEGLTVKSMMVESRGIRKAGEPKYRYSISAFPTIGEPHSLVVLVEYPDYGFNVDDPKGYFEDFLNGENFSRNGGTGSCRQYYIENSSGAFKPTFDVLGPVMLKNNRKYYGGGNEDKACEMVVEAVEALDDEIDFSKYDHNNDGYVDSIYIIYADRGEADGGPSESVWPYSWELEEEDIFLEADGVKFNTYGVSNELKSEGVMEGIGTFTHEFGHVLGLPDLYNTEKYNDYSTPLEWSLMDSGNYNNDSRTPCNLSSFERYSLGWLTPREIVASGDYFIENLSRSNKAFIMTTEEKEDEFFLVEYRLQDGWDKYLPSHGMLIWHIDFNQNLWDWNTPNNVKDHHRVDLVRADNLKDRGTLEGDPFPGLDNNDEFSASSTPSLKSWSGVELNVNGIFNIREENGGLCSFEVSIKEERGPYEDTTSVDEIMKEPEIIISGNGISISEGEHSVYDLSGRIVGIVRAGKFLDLNKGIYILNGKKIIL